jgi:hypothetical protein
MAPHVVRYNSHLAMGSPDYSLQNPLASIILDTEYKVALTGHHSADA